MVTLLSTSSLEVTSIVWVVVTVSVTLFSIPAGLAVTALSFVSMTLSPTPVEVDVTLFPSLVSVTLLLNPVRLELICSLSFTQVSTLVRVAVTLEGTLLVTLTPIILVVKVWNAEWGMWRTPGWGSLNSGVSVLSVDAVLEGGEASCEMGVATLGGYDLFNQ